MRYAMVARDMLATISSAPVLLLLCLTALQLLGWCVPSAGAERKSSPEHLFEPKLDWQNDAWKREANNTFEQTVVTVTRLRNTMYIIESSKPRFHRV